MNILIDMNLSPGWEQVLGAAGHSAVHWSRIGPANAKDAELLAWAKENSHIVFTHDLDFGAILAGSQADGPSVLQVRTQDVSIEQLGKLIVSVLAEVGKHLDQGAIITVDKNSARVRILPLR